MSAEMDTTNESGVTTVEIVVRMAMTVPEDARSRTHPFRRQRWAQLGSKYAGADQQAHQRQLGAQALGA
jgi:hypothetical protein